MSLSPVLRNYDEPKKTPPAPAQKKNESVIASIGSKTYRTDIPRPSQTKRTTDNPAPAPAQEGNTDLENATKRREALINHARTYTLEHLVDGGGCYVDPQGRMFAPSTGRLDLRRINILTTQPHYLDMVASDFGLWIAGQLHLKDKEEQQGRLQQLLRRKRAFNYVASTGSTAANTLNNALQKYFLGMPVTKSKQFIYNIDKEGKLKGEAIVVADAVRTGETLIATVRKLSEHGATVQSVFCLFDYEFGAQQCLTEAFNEKAPQLYSMLKRTDAAFWRQLDYLWQRAKTVKTDNKKPISIDAIAFNDQDRAKLRLADGIMKYQLWPITYVVSKLHDEFVVNGKEPHEFLIPTRVLDGDERKTARLALERAILRYTIEVELYSPEQNWLNPHEKRSGKDGKIVEIPPAERETRGKHLASHKELLKGKINEVRTAYLERCCPDGLPWIKKLPDDIDDTRRHAVVDKYSLNGQNEAHMLHVREFFRLLKKHATSIPHNICGIPDFDRIGVGTHVYR